MLGHTARDMAYLESLDLSEQLNFLISSRKGDVAALELFADAEWQLVDRLDRFAQARSTRGMRALREAAFALSTGVPALRLPAEHARAIHDKLERIIRALDAEAVLEEQRRLRFN